MIYTVICLMDAFQTGMIFTQITTLWMYANLLSKKMKIKFGGDLNLEQKENKNAIQKAKNL